MHPSSHGTAHIGPSGCNSAKPLRLLPEHYSEQNGNLKRLSSIDTLLYLQAENIEAQRLLIEKVQEANERLARLVDSNKRAIEVNADRLARMTEESKIQEQKIKGMIGQHAEFARIYGQPRSEREAFWEWDTQLRRAN
jgi:hypothetical protein